MEMRQRRGRRKSMGDILNFHVDIVGVERSRRRRQVLVVIGIVVHVKWLLRLRLLWRRGRLPCDRMLELLVGGVQADAGNRGGCWCVR
jgi:hypothetical protein